MQLRKLAQGDPLNIWRKTMIPAALPKSFRPLAREANNHPLTLSRGDNMSITLDDARPRNYPAVENPTRIQFMTDPELITEIDSNADKYAKFAIRNLFADQQIEEIYTRRDQLVERTDANSHLDEKEILALVAQEEFSRLRLHFIFPNLDQEERDMLAHLDTYRRNLERGVNADITRDAVDYSDQEQINELKELTNRLEQTFMRQKGQVEERLLHKPSPLQRTVLEKLCNIHWR